MATPLLPILLLLLHTSLNNGETSSKDDLQPMVCTNPSPGPACSSSRLYVVPRGASPSEIASRYSADASLIKTITRPSGAIDFLVEVPCGCESAGNFTALLHDTVYEVLPDDSAYRITKEVFGGLAWGIPELINPTDNITVHLACGCPAPGTGGGRKVQAVVVSYAVQSADTLTTIAALLDSNVEAIEQMNPNVNDNPDYLTPGQVLFVPMGAPSSSTPPPPPPPPPSKG